ncbi:MAG: hypothetical protein EHM64_16750 [Ignavibacteriae bacterium]|nr:MAG: hypothetical protein EHM64_16750 [Ignavibacteriota bacterium]
MKKYIVIMMAALSVGYGQQQEQDTLFIRKAEVDTLFLTVPVPVFSMGVSGGATFLNPESINDQIEFNNSVFNESQSAVHTVAQWTAWLSFRPKNMPTFFSVRGEYISVARTFSYIGTVTDAAGSMVRTFRSTFTSRYSVYPFSVNSGSYIPKTTLKAEIGFVYAYATLDNSTNMNSYGSSSNSYDGEGYGFRMDLQQIVPLSGAFSMTLEIGYRYLVLDDFRDTRGRRLNDFSVSYSGVSVQAGLSYGF